LARQLSHFKIYIGINTKHCFAADNNAQAKQHNQHNQLHLHPTMSLFAAAAAVLPNLNKQIDHEIINAVVKSLIAQKKPGKKMSRIDKKTNTNPYQVAIDLLQARGVNISLAALKQRVSRANRMQNKPVVQEVNVGVSPSTAVSTLTPTTATPPTDVPNVAPPNSLAPTSVTAPKMNVVLTFSTRRSQVDKTLPCQRISKNVGSVVSSGLDASLLLPPHTPVTMRVMLTMM
jgi:hypothetical protein